MSATPDGLRREASRWLGRNELLRQQLLQAAEALEAANLEKSESRESLGGDARLNRLISRAEGRRCRPV